MTKEEFLKMVDTVLEQLGKDKDKSLSRVEYYKSVNPNGTEFTTANYQYLVAKMKVDFFRKLIGLPAFTRIQAMTDAEIAEYKKDRISKIKLDIITINAEIEKVKKEIEALKVQHEEIVTHFAELDMEKRNSAINEGKRIQSDIHVKESKLNELESKLKQLNSQQEEISKLDSNDVKSQLISEIGTIGSRHELYGITGDNDEINSSRSLMATVGKDPERALELAKLLTELAFAEKKYADIYVELDTGYNLPTQLVQMIANEYAVKYNGGRIKSTKEYYEIYQNFMEQFNKEASIFGSQFTEEKFGGLIKRTGDPHFLSPGKYTMLDVDFGFLELHSDKFSSKGLELLKAKVSEREKLSKKIIKTKAVKQQIADLDHDIDQMQIMIYKKIWGWYQEYDAHDILGINIFFMVNNPSIERFPELLQKCITEINKTRSALDGFKGRLQIAEVGLENQFKQYQAKVNGIKQQIRALGGSGFEDAQIPLTQEKTEDNLNNIAASVAYEERRQFVSQVQEEAQNQANIWQPNSNTNSQQELIGEENIGGKSL